MNATTVRRLMNLWPPFLFSGIHVTRIASDFRAVDVCLMQHWFNRHIHSAHFGGSLFAMTDPFYALMVRWTLGDDYIVWDQHASIHFRSPGRGTVCASFVLDDAALATIRSAVASGEKVLHDFSVDILDAGGTIVASVAKTIYVRRKRTAA